MYLAILRIMAIVGLNDYIWYKNCHYVHTGILIPLLQVHVFITGSQNLQDLSSDRGDE